ncbi:MAG: CPBP family intramembrane metalloprotease [Saprospiraceae bacterium]|nr:CPBP family intramembrane metalloprotease [Saprospiraceae bacterium]
MAGSFIFTAKVRFRSKSMNERPPFNFFDSLPAIAQIILLLLAMVLGLFIGQLAGLGLAELSGLGREMLSDPSWKPSDSFERTIYRSIALVGHLFTFLIPALLYARFLIRDHRRSYMQTNNRPQPWQLFYGSFWIIVAFPVAQYLYVLNQGIPLPKWATSLEDSTNELIQALLVMETPFEFLFTLFVMALVPAVGEEFIFRGLIQRFLEKGSQNSHIAILISATIFSAFHFQFEGFLPRLMLGLMLGYLFFWTRSLWVPIFVHFIYNGLQVAAAYFAPEAIGEAAENPDLSVETYQLILALGLTFLLGYYIRSRSQQLLNPPTNE